MWRLESHRQHVPEETTDYKLLFEETGELYDEQPAAFAELCTVAMDTADNGLRTLPSLTICMMTCAISVRNARLARSRTSTSLSPTDKKHPLSSSTCHGRQVLSKLPDRHWSHSTNVPEYLNFISVSMTMKAANNKGIGILRDVVIRFAGNSGNRRLQTRRVAYMTDTSDRIFLSRASRVHLGMISDKFPTLGEVNLATSE